MPPRAACTEAAASPSRPARQPEPHPRAAAARNSSGTQQQSHAHGHAPPGSAPARAARALVAIDILGSVVALCVVDLVDTPRLETETVLRTPNSKLERDAYVKAKANYSTYV